MEAKVKCKKCGRTLKNPLSIDMGMGPKCAGVSVTQGKGVKLRSARSYGKTYPVVSAGSAQLPLIKGQPEKKLSRKKLARLRREERRVLVKARAETLPMAPEIVGSHWAADVQVDVVAVNWHDKSTLIGECKWAVDTVARPAIRELIDKAPKVVPGEGWQVFYAYFSRAGFTDAARQEAQTVDALLVDLEALDRGLGGV